MPMTKVDVQESESIEEILERVVKSTGGESISVEEVLQTLGVRSYGPMLLFTSLLELFPLLGAIPGAYIVVALIVILLAGQLPLLGAIPGAYIVVALIVILLAILFFPLAFIPSSEKVLAVPIFFFGLALTARDGLLALIGLGFTLGILSLPFVYWDELTQALDTLAQSI
jgi:hypothetical protein